MVERREWLDRLLCNSFWNTEQPQQQQQQQRQPQHNTTTTTTATTTTATTTTTTSTSTTTTKYYIDGRFQINSKRSRAESFEVCCRWALLSMKTNTLLFTSTVQKYIYPSVIMTETFQILLKVQANGPFN